MGGALSARFWPLQKCKVSLEIIARSLVSPRGTPWGIDSEVGVGVEVEVGVGVEVEVGVEVGVGVEVEVG
jgi:hypothetical protein